MRVFFYVFKGQKNKNKSVQVCTKKLIYIKVRKLSIFALKWIFWFKICSYLHSLYRLCMPEHKLPFCAILGMYDFGNMQPFELEVPQKNTTMKLFKRWKFRQWVESCLDTMVASTDCWVFKQGVQNWNRFCLKITQWKLLNFEV